MQILFKNYLIRYQQLFLPFIHSLLQVMIDATQKTGGSKQQHFTTITSVTCRIHHHLISFRVIQQQKQRHTFFAFGFLLWEGVS